MPLGLLKSNLQEIDSTARHNGILIASGWGTRVYEASKGWGKLWHWFYNIAELFGAKQFRNSALVKAMQKTHTLFAQEQKAIEGHAVQYKEYLGALRRGEKASSSKVRQARGEITSWNEGVRPFLERVHRDADLALLKLFEKHYGAKPPFTWKKISDELHNLQRVIDLESLFHTQLPLKVLAKLSIKEGLSKWETKDLEQRETKDLDRWMKKFNKSSEERIRPIHKALIAFVKHLGGKADLLELELELILRGCQLFTHADPKHTAFRDSLKEGDTLSCNGKKVVLGPELGGKRGGKENHQVVFAVQGDDSRVVVIGNNQASVGLRKILSERQGILFHTPDVYDLDVTKGIALMERLEEPLKDYDWSSDKRGLNPVDKNVIDPITNVIRWLVDNQRTPHNFAIESLMYTKKDEKGERLLKCLKVPLEAEFDYNAIEAFAFSVARGNLQVWKYMMEASGMLLPINLKSKASPFAVFYKDVFRRALKGDETPMETVATTRKVAFKSIVERGKVFYDEVVKVKEECCRASGADEVKVKKVMIKLYEDMFLISTLWPDFTERVIKELNAK